MTETRPGDLLRTMARWAPALYAFLVVCMSLNLYLAISRHADFAVLPGAVGTLMLVSMLFVASLFARPWMRRRADKMDEGDA